MQSVIYFLSLSVPGGFHSCATDTRNNKFNIFFLLLANFHVFFYGLTTSIYLFFIYYISICLCLCCCYCCRCRCCCCFRCCWCCCCCCKLSVGINYTEYITPSSVYILLNNVNYITVVKFHF